jgi:hypothetical protein
MSQAKGPLSAPLGRLLLSRNKAIIAIGRTSFDRLPE